MKSIENGGMKSKINQRRKAKTIIEMAKEKWRKRRKRRNEKRERK
jgi:hypothetical protein